MNIFSSLILGLTISSHDVTLFFHSKKDFFSVYDTVGDGYCTAYVFEICDTIIM